MLRASSPCRVALWTPSCSGKEQVGTEEGHPEPLVSVLCLTPVCPPSYVLPDDSKGSRQRTRVVKRSLNPLFNHTMVYDGFQAKDLAEACAEFTLWHHEAFSKRQLGGIRLSLGTGERWGGEVAPVACRVARPRGDGGSVSAGSSYGLPVGWMDSTAEERQVWGRLLQQPGHWVEALLPLRTDLVPRA